MINATGKKRTIPTLQKLAAETIKRTNPNLFFRFYHQPLLPEIQEEYVNPFITEFFKRHQEAYLHDVAQRKKTVKIKSTKLSHNICFNNGCICLNGLCTSGIYLSIGYPLLQFTHASWGATATFYALVPLLLAVGSCSSICLMSFIARAIVECTTSAVIKNEIVVDLEAQTETKTPHRSCIMM